MIDPELRDIIAPELAEGEELLWAEKMNETKISEALLRSKQGRTISIIITLFAAVASLYFLFVQMHQGWAVMSLTLLVILTLELWGEKRSEKTLTHMAKRGYALTSHYLYVLDAHFNILTKETADNIKDVSGANSVCLNGIGPRGKAYYLEYLSNPTVTINFLHSEIDNMRSAA